jgi:hypothetical protein
MNLPKSLICKRALVAAFSLLLLSAMASTVVAEVYTKGRLTSNSPISRVLRPGCFFHRHTVTLHAGVTYTIDLRSTDFDAYLILTDDDGGVLARDDDSGGGLDARIVFRAPYTGEYEIYATTFSEGARGNYTLLVRP